MVSEVTEIALICEVLCLDLETHGPLIHVGWMKFKQEEKEPVLFWISLSKEVAEH